MKKVTKMSKAEQRVLVCQDSIQQLKRGTIVVGKASGYITITRVGREIRKIKRVRQLNKCLSSITCEVCAKGALFIGHISRFNNLVIDNSGYFPIHHSDIRNRLKPLFGDYLLDKIEAAYERRVIQDNSRKLLEDGRYMSPMALKCVEFGYQYSNARTRFIKIMENIIENKGQFKP